MANPPVERTFARNDDYELEYVSEEELDRYLEEIVPGIGWVIVYFNSLEDHVSDFIRQAILRDFLQDDRLDVFLSEMMFAGKCRALIHLYGQMIESKAVSYTHEHLNALETMLLECSSRRNEYAHADWIGVREEGYVRVKAQSKKTGVFHRYKKFDLECIKEDAEFISSARFKLFEFNEKIHEQLWGRG